MLSAVTTFLQNASCSCLTLIVLTLLLSIWVFSSIRDRGVPPGPVGLPYFGYWPFLKNETCQEQLLELKKQYGDVFSFRVTGQLYINLGSLKTLREAHLTKGDCFTDRPTNHHILQHIFDNGLPFANGENWQTIRKFFLQQFRERGMTVSKENTSEAISQAVATVVQQLASQANEPVNVLKFLEKATNHIIRHTLLGPNTPISEMGLIDMLENYRFVNTAILPANLILYGKLARYLILPFSPNYKEAMKTLESTKCIIHKWVDEHRRTFDEDNMDRDVIDSYFKERNLRRSKGDPTYQYFTDETLMANLLQFVGDGIINSSTFVSYFLKALLDHPEEQEKIFEELTEVCGVNRNPTLADKSRLTYTNAFLLEALRCNSFNIAFPNLMCTQETTINGYRIPRGAITLPNVNSIHNDPQTYEDPHLFNPSRFLTRDGKQKQESPVTFGIGKRACLGEGFVMLNTFLFCAIIVKNFRISYYRPKTYYELFTTRQLEIKVEPRK